MANATIYDNIEQLTMMDNGDKEAPMNDAMTRICTIATKSGPNLIHLYFNQSSSLVLHSPLLSFLT